MIRQLLRAFSITLLICACLFPLAGLTAPAAPDQKADEPRVEDKPSILTMEPLPAEPKDDELHKLLKERFNAALGELKVKYRRNQLETTSKLTFVDLYPPARRLKRAGLEVFNDPKEKIALLEKYVEFTKYMERTFIKLRKFGDRTVAPDELELASYYRADAEIELLRLKSKKPK